MRRLLFAVFAVCSTLVFAQDAGRGRGAAPKNLQILKPEEIRATMAAFVQGTGLMCDGCHVADRSSDEKATKVTARKMLAMVRSVNANTFNGDNKVTCYTCHRGEAQPKSTP
jgi:hypothetical protein